MRFNDKLPERNRKRNPLKNRDDRTASGFHFDEQPPALRAGRRHDVYRVAQSYNNNYSTETTDDQLDGTDDLTLYKHTLNRICFIFNYDNI